MPETAELTDLLAAEADTIVQDAVDSLRRSHMKHYDAAGDEYSHDALRRLFDIVVECVRCRRLAPISAYFEQVAQRRYDSGFGLHEVQTAVNALEEAIWRRVMEHFSAGSRAEALTLVSTVLGKGKDTLAQRYVELATKRKAPPLDLSGYFKGELGV